MSIPAGRAVFRAFRSASTRGQEASVEAAARPGYPNFIVKFAEAHGCGRLRKAQAALDDAPGRTNFARQKRSPRRCSFSNRESSGNYGLSEAEVSDNAIVSVIGTYTKERHLCESCVAALAQVPLSV